MTVQLIRDYALIFLVVEVTVVLVALLVLALRILNVLTELRARAMPILDRVEDTFETVQGTTTVVNETVVSPVIKVASFAAGAQRAFKTLVRTNGSGKEK